MLRILQLARRDVLENRHVGSVEVIGCLHFLFDLLHAVEKGLRGELFSLPRDLRVDRSERRHPFHQNLVSRHRNQCTGALCHARDDYADVFIFPAEELDDVLGGLA